MCKWIHLSLRIFVHFRLLAICKPGSYDKQQDYNIFKSEIWDFDILQNGNLRFGSFPMIITAYDMYIEPTLITSIYVR
jgi:hypothetical protein